MIEKIYQIKNIKELKTLEAMTQALLQRPECTRERAEKLNLELLAIRDRLQILQPQN